MRLTINKKRLSSDLRTLARFGEYQTGVNRPALSVEDIAARNWLRNRMEEAGLEAIIDGVGNVIGRTPGHHKRIILGSHTDTVPFGGWLDGAMGVIYGLEIARAYMEAGGNNNIGIEVVSFNDEEGRFYALLGSHFYCGLLEKSDLTGIHDTDGISLQESLENAGFAGREIATLDPAKHIAYLEAHIEQGPVLENEKRTIGLVTEIVGIRRNRVKFYGQADHAGTTPMKLRKDAAAALYNMATRLEALYRSEGGPHTVWNLGKTRIEPGTLNVVCSFAELFIEYRDPSSETLRKLQNKLDQLSAEVADRYRVEKESAEVATIEPTKMNPMLVGRLEAAAKNLKKRHMRLHSGAGHDAMVLVKRIPAAMLFVPSIGGRSHDINENTQEYDLFSGAQVLSQTVSDLVDDHP